jgi:hypothetical protein
VVIVQANNLKDSLVPTPATPVIRSRITDTRIAAAVLASYILEARSR